MASFGLASALLVIGVGAPIVLPGYPAYIGAYASLVAALVALLIYGWPERITFRHPSSLAILAAIALLSVSVPFVYHGPQDLLPPLLVLPMLVSPAMGLLARPARWLPSVSALALICLLGSFAAFVGGAYEHFVLGLYRPGLGNNPIHYSSLAAMAGCLAMVGVVSSEKRWRYAFLLGPILAVGCAIIADSRGPMLGALVMSGIGALTLLVWLRHDRLFRVVMLGVAALAVGTAVYLVGTGNARVASIVQSGLDIFRFTGGPDDIRAAFYVSAIEILRTSPVVGVGLGQIISVAETLFPSLVGGTSLENFHADWANFAGMAGALGLLAWALLLAAPLLLLLDIRVRQERPIVLGALILFTGQFTLGVSNATFGNLPQTTIYAAAL